MAVPDICGVFATSLAKMDDIRVIRLAESGLKDLSNSRSAVLIQDFRYRGTVSSESGLLVTGGRPYVCPSKEDPR